MVVQDLSYRWDARGKGGKLYFRWRTLLPPPDIIAYLVVHEFVHPHEPYHTTRFWDSGGHMPDFAARKQWPLDNGWRSTL